MLVFHHPFVVKIKSPLPEGDLTNRGLVHFKNSTDAIAHTKELAMIIYTIVQDIPKNLKSTFLQKKIFKMGTKIFVNLPVKNLDKSKAFFIDIGFKINQQFTDNTAACIVITEEIYAMILTYEKFKEFTHKEIVDANKATEVLTCLSFDTKEKVHELVDNAIAAGATETRAPQDYGFMIGRSFNDPDGHIWEIIWMDPAAIPG